MQLTLHASPAGVCGSPTLPIASIARSSARFREHRRWESSRWDTHAMGGCVGFDVIQGIARFVSRFEGLTRWVSFLPFTS